MNERNHLCHCSKFDAITNILSSGNLNKISYFQLTSAMIALYRIKSLTLQAKRDL